MKMLKKKRYKKSYENNFLCSPNIYKGLNMKIKLKTFIFEIQFHTESTFQLKQKIHKLYKLYISDDISINKKCQLYDKMINLSKSVKIPKYKSSICNKSVPPDNC